MRYVDQGLMGIVCHYCSYRTPSGIVSGIQWVKADPNSITPPSTQPYTSGVSFQSSIHIRHLSVFTIILHQGSSNWNTASVSSQHEWCVIFTVDVHDIPDYRS